MATGSALKPSHPGLAGMDGPLPLHPQGSTPIALGAVAVGVRDVAEGAWRSPWIFREQKGQVSRKSGKIWKNGW